SGAAYAVTVLTQPTGQSCVVSAGSGIVGPAMEDRRDRPWTPLRTGLPGPSVLAPPGGSRGPPV
ncbi:MAG: hypothetical protein ACLQD8_08855, partial [Thermoplasmata archaeon]